MKLLRENAPRSGARPGDQPFEPLTKLLVINIKTARNILVTIPKSLLAGADEVVQQRGSAAAVKRRK